MGSLEKLNNVIRSENWPGIDLGSLPVVGINFPLKENFQKILILI